MALLVVEDGFEVFEEFGGGDGFLPDEGGAEFVDADAVLGFGAGEDDDGEFGADAVHFLEEGVAGEVGEGKVDEDGGPAVGPFGESEEAGDSVLGVSNFVAVGVQDLDDEAGDFLVVLDMEDVAFGAN
jgi:hypothetical protein